MRDRTLAVALVVPFLIGGYGIGAVGLLGGDRVVAEPQGVQVAFSFADPEIIESSGLALLADPAEPAPATAPVLTVNDSGDSGRVFVVDPSTGETLGETRWEADPEDVEALATGPDGDVWVGDIGDNTSSRPSVSVLRVPVSTDDATVDPVVYPLTYPGGARDAEAMLVHPGTGRVYVVSKSIFGGGIYAAPRRLSPDGNRLEQLGDAPAIVTDGAFFPDGRHLVLRDYSRAVVLAFPSLEEVAGFGLPSQEQGEGIAVLDDRTLLVSSEGRNAEVLAVPLPADVRAAMAPSPSPTPSPTATGPTLPAPTPPPASREGLEVPEVTTTERPVWPWFLTGWLGLGVIVLLIWSLRRR